MLSISISPEDARSRPCICRRTNSSNFWSVTADHAVELGRGLDVGSQIRVLLRNLEARAFGRRLRRRRGVQGERGDGQSDVRRPQANLDLVVVERGDALDQSGDPLRGALSHDVHVVDGGADAAFEAIPEILDLVHEGADVLEDASDLLELGDDALFSRCDRAPAGDDALVDVGAGDLPDPVRVAEHVRGQGGDGASVSIWVVRRLQLLVVGDQQPIDEVLEERPENGCGVRIAQDPVFDLAHAGQDATHAAGEAQRRVMRVGKTLCHGLGLSERGLEVVLYVDHGAGDTHAAVAEVGDCAQHHERVGIHVDVDAPFLRLFRQPAGVAQSVVGEVVGLAAWHDLPSHPRRAGRSSRCRPRKARFRFAAAPHP